MYKLKQMKVDHANLNERPTSFCQKQIIRHILQNWDFHGPKSYKYPKTKNIMLWIYHILCRWSHPALAISNDMSGVSDVEYDTLQSSFAHRENWYH